jgi:hypothetical protein
VNNLPAVIEQGVVDILYLSYKRVEHMRRTLPALLDSCDESSRVWVWQNGQDAAATAFVKEYEAHPRVHCVHYSNENIKLRGPTNWLWRQSGAEFVAKVDDDCVMPTNWTASLRSYFADEPKMGIISCWHYLDEDFVPDIARRKIIKVGGNREMLRNAWVGGSGYLMRRSIAVELGGIRDTESFTQFCVRAARKGWLVGWAYPFIKQIHLDDPKAPGAIVTSDEALLKHCPLSARNFGANGVDGWNAWLRADARYVQMAPYQAWKYLPAVSKCRRLLSRLRRANSSDHA